MTGPGLVLADVQATFLWHIGEGFPMVLWSGSRLKIERSSVQTLASCTVADTTIPKASPSRTIIVYVYVVSYIGSMWEVKELP